MEDLSVKQMTDRVVGNDLTWPRAVLVQFLTSFFKHSKEFNRSNYQWKEDSKKTDIAILSSRSDLSDVKESADRVIIERQTFSGQPIITDNRIKVDNGMFVHSIVKPRLGYLNIYCESQNEIFAEFIATQVEMVILMHKELLLEWNVGVGDPTLSDVRTPVSGINFYSMLISVPTIVSSEAEFEVTNPRMINNIEMEFGIGSAINFEVKTE